MDHPKGDGSVLRCEGGGNDDCGQERLLERIGIGFGSGIGVEESGWVARWFVEEDELTDGGGMQEAAAGCGLACSYHGQGCVAVHACLCLGGPRPKGCVVPTFADF